MHVYKHFVRKFELEFRSNCVDVFWPPLFALLWFMTWLSVISGCVVVHGVLVVGVCLSSGYN